MEKHAFVRSIDSDEGVNVIFRTLQERLPLILKRFKEEKELVRSIGSNELLNYTTKMVATVIHTDTTILPRIVQAIKEWVIMQRGPAEISIEVPPSSLGVRVYSSMFGTPGAELSLLSSKELLYVCFYISVVMIRVTAEAFVDVERESDYIEEFSNEEGTEIWNGLSEWPLAILRYAWYHRTESTSSQRVVLAAGQALGALSRVDVNCFITTVSKAIQQYPVDSRSKRTKMTAQWPAGMDSIFFALSYVVLPQDISGDAKLTEMRNLLNMVSQYTTSKLPKDPEQLSRLYGLLEGLEYFLSQVNFADVGPAAGAAGGRFDASNSALRRLFSSKVQPIYAWATNISRANDLKVKAGALRTMCSILSCAPFDFFRNNFSNFVQKRVLYNMGIQRKAYNLVPLLLKVLRGPSLQGRGGRGCGGTFTLIHSWHRKGAVWDQLESKTAEGENCVDNTGQWSRVCRPGLHSSILVTTQLQSICRTMFRKKTITKLPRATFPTLIAIGAQLAVHSLTMVFGECIRPLLRGGTKVDDLLCAGVALRIVLQILDPNFQTEASERARLAQDEDSEMQWRRRLQNFMNQLEGDVNRIIDSCISVCSSRRPLQKSNDSTYESTIREENKDNGEIQPASSSKFLPSPRRWRRAGLVSRVRKRGVDDINSREPIILLPTRVSLLNCPSTKNMNGIGDDSQKVENYFMQAELKALSSAFPERVQTVDVDAEIKKSQDHKRIDAAMIAEDSLGAALSVLIFVRPVTPAQSLGKLLHPSMKKATKGMVSRYVRRVCVYQPEGFPSLIFSIVKRIIATAGRDSGGTAILLNNIRIAVVEWGGACVEAAGAEGGTSGPQAPGWLKHARRSVLPVIHAVSLCLLSHPSVMTRKAALSLTKEATEVETKLINSWSGWTQSPNEEVEARVVSRSLAFSLIEGVNGESVLAASATDSYHRHFSRFYLPSDSAASINISSMPRVPWMSSLVSIAQSLYMPQFGKNLANAFESQSSRKCSFASKRQQVGALALKIGLAMNKRLLQQDPEPPLTDSEKEWCFASVPLLLALSPIVASPPNYTPLSTRTDKEETKERARRKNTQKRDRKHWKRLMVTEQKEVQIRMEKNSKQLKNLMKLISTSESFLQSCDFADPNVEVASEDSLDYAASIAMIARNAELNPEGGMKALLFAIENAHSNYIPWILESFVLFSNLPTIKNTSSDSEVRLRNGELLRTRTDATRSMLFYALSGNKSLAHACSSNSGLAEALIVEAMRANTERVVAWGLGSVTIRNAARSIRNIGSTLLLQKIPKDRRNGNTFISLPDKRNLSLSVSRSHTDDKSSRIDNIDLVIPVPMVLDKVTTLLAWAQATSDALTVNNDRILKEMKVWSRRKRPARARSNIRASNTSVFKRMGSGSEESQNNDKNGTTGIHAAAKLDITATAQTPMAESTPGSPLRKLPVSSRANSKSISVISTIPENTDKTPEKIRNVIGTFLLKSRPDSNEKEEIKAWVVDLMELRNACFEAIGSLVWVGGLGVGKKAADIYDENPDDLELWRRYDEDIDIEARKSAQGWIRSFLATEVVSINTKPGSNGIESPSMFALGSSIGYSFRKSKLRMQNKPLNTPKISCHPREAYGALCALLMHHWTVVFDVILNEVYSPIPRGGAFGRGTAFAAIASRFQEISIAGARDSSQHTRSITSLTAQRGVFNQSIEFCSEMKLGTTSNEAAISKENAVELLIVGMTYAGHPILKISDMGVRILCALGPSFCKLSGSIWPFRVQEYVLLKDDALAPGPAERRRRSCTLMEKIFRSIDEVDKERIRRCLIQRLLSVRKVIDIACETTHNRERHQYPAGNIDTFYRGDRTVAPFPHLILPLTATEAGEWTTTSDALSWMLRVARPFLQAYPTSTNRTGDSSDRDSMDKVFKTLVNEKPNHYLATLIGLSVVLGNSVNGTDQVVEDALAELWYSTLFNFPDLTDPMDIQTTNTTGLEATATKRKSERKRHDSTAMSEKRLRERNNLIAVVLPAIVLCLRLLSGAPGISYSGIFQADFIRVASLSSHLQIHSSPALSICRMVAMAASRGGRVYTVSMKSFLTWTLCQSNFLAEVWWKSKATRGGNENDFENTFHMRQEGERYIWGAAAGLLSQLLRVEKVIENEKNHEENERNLGKLFFSCFHHLEGSPCLSPSLLKYLLQRLSKMRHKNTDSLGDFIIPHGLHLRRYYWRDTESFEDENKIINTFGEMRNPKGSWLADFVSPAPLPRRGIAARAGRPLDADAAWRRGMSLILVEEVRKDAEIGVDVNSRHNDSSYFDLKASSRVLLQENFDIASGRTTTDDISKGTEILSELINPAFIGLERGNSGVISADSLLCGIVHQLIKRRRTVMLKAWMEEALKHTERIVNGPDSKLKIASPSSAASARQLRDLLAILSPSFACKLDLSRRISAVLSEIIPKPREVSIHIAARKTSSEKTLVIPRLPAVQVNFMHSLAQVLVARVWRGGGNYIGGEVDEGIEGFNRCEEISERHVAFWGLASLMETGISRIFRTASVGLLISLRSTCFSQKISNPQHLSFRPPTPIHVAWLIRMTSRALCRSNSAPNALLTLPLILLLSDVNTSNTLNPVDFKGGIQMDLKKTITKEKIVCIMGLMLPWIYCLYDARSPTDQRLTQSAELLSSECFQVEVAPESLCESLASSIEILHEELGSKDVELVNLCTVLRSNYSSMLRLMSTAAVQLLRMVKKARGSNGPYFSHILGCVLSSLHFKSPHAVVKEGVLRFTSMILKESPTHLGIKSLHLTALISALKPLIEEVMKAGDEAARDVVASYVWSARATTTLTENNVAKMGRIELWEPLGKHGSPSGLLNSRGFLREIAERGWVDHKSLVDTNRCFQWIGKGIPMEIQHEITQQEGWSSAHQLNSKEDIKSTPIRSSQAHIQGREVQISFGELYDKKIQQKNKDALEKPSISSKAAKILGFNGSEKLPSSEDKGFLRSKSSSVKIKIQTQTNKGKGTNERKIAAHIAGRNSSPPFLQKRGSLRPSSPLRGRTVDESMAKRDGQTKTADTGMPNMARKKVSSRERKALNSALLSAGLVEPLDVHHRQHIKKNLRYTDSNGERIHTNSGNQKQTAEKNDAAARLAAVIRGGVAKTRNAKHEMIEPIHKATSQQFQKQELGNVSQKVTLQKTCDKKETTVEEDLVSKYLNLSNEKNKVLDDENVQSYTAEKEDNDENCQDAHEEDFDEDEDEMWEEVRSPTGDMYFWNTITDEVQWERPACMKTSGENSHGLLKM